MEIKATTIIAVKRDGKTVIAGDGQATLGNQVFKSHTHKVKKIYHDQVIIACAGNAADGFQMSEDFEKMLNKYSGSLLRSAVEFAKQIRQNKRGGDDTSVILVADKDNLLWISSNGDIIEPDNGVCGTGSGGAYAQAAALALLQNTNLSAREIAQKAIEIASDICIYTNKNFVIEEV